MQAGVSSPSIKKEKIFSHWASALPSTPDLCKTLHAFLEPAGMHGAKMRQFTLDGQSFKCFNRRTGSFP